MLYQGQTALNSVSKMGHISVSDVRDALTDKQADIDSVDRGQIQVNGGIPVEFANVSSEVLDSGCSCDEQVLTYITGYVVHKYMHREPCMTCTSTFIQDRDMIIADDSGPNCQYVSAMDRGGLKYPTLLSVMFGYKVFCTMQLLVSEQYESKFLHMQQQKKIVCAIVKDSVSKDDFFQSYGCDICTVCNKSPVDILHSMLSSFVNIFMNNYTKRCNDQTCSSGGKKGDRKATRKLKTLT